MINFDVKLEEDKILDKFLNSMIDSRIGILEKKNPMYEGNKTNVASVLAEHCFGNISKNIPIRDPLFQPVKQNKENIVNKLSQLFKKNITEYIDQNKKINTQELMKKTIQELSFYILNDIVKKKIYENGNGDWAPLSEITIKKKGNNDMLRDTYLLLKSLDFEVI